MRKLFSVSILLFCFVLISTQNKGQVKTQVTPQKKDQVKATTTPQKKGQAKTPVSPQKKGQITAKPVPQNRGQITNAVTPCKWQKNEVDPFTGVTAKNTSWEIVGYNANTSTTINNGLTGDYKFSISENIQNKDTSFMLWIRTSTSQNLCFNKDSKILIKSGQTILTINLLGETICGKNLNSYGNLDTDTRKFLKKHPVDLLRIQFSNDANAVINVDLKDVDKYSKLETGYFIRTLKCFE